MLYVKPWITKKNMIAVPLAGNTIIVVTARGQRFSATRF